MAARILLYLDADGLATWRWNSGRLQRGPFFQADEQGQAEFIAWLDEHQGERFTLVVDAVEEGFQQETIPHVLGPDRRALLARKQNQLFYGSPYVTALPLGRERAGRRDERLLFAAITRPAMLEPWMDALRATGVILTGITSAALLASHIVKPMLQARPRLLLVSHGRAGIRQTLFEDGKLRFSRLGTLPEATYDDWVASISFEVQKTYQYLVTQRVIARGSPLPVVVLAARKDLQAMRRQCVDSEVLQYTELDLSQRAAALGLQELPPESDALPLVLHLAAREVLPYQFAPNRDRTAFRWWQAQRIALAVGAIGLVAGLLFAAKTMLDVRRLDDATTETRLDAQARQLRYERLLGALPRLPASLDALQTSMARVDRIETLAGGMGPALSRLSRVLDRHPEIEVQRIEWSLAPRVLDGLGDSGNPPAQASPNRAPAAAASAPNLDAVNLLVVQATLVGEETRSQREALAAIEALAAELRQEGASEASILRLPFDYTSDRTLRSTPVDATGTAFVLRAAFPQEAS